MPADRSRTRREPILKRITERITPAAQPFLAELQRQETTLGIVHGEDADTNISNPFKTKQLPIPMP